MAKIELHKVAGRDRLSPRRDPYFQRLETGKALGFRKMTSTSPGSWIARYREQDTGRQIHEPLGTFENLPPSERFDAARRAALAWMTHLERGGRLDVVTVADACRVYAEHIASTKGDKQADDLRARYRRWIDADPLGPVELLKLKREHVRAWRARLHAAPITSKAGDTRPRSDSAVNRDMTAVRAALNHALAEGAVASSFAWDEPLKATAGADGRRTVYLTPQQRRDLIANASDEIRPLLRGLAILPLRPGALASLTVADFDRQQGTLRIRADKAGAGRIIKLPAGAAALLADCSRDKLPGAPLFARADGEAWNKDAWKGPVKAAVIAAGLPADAVAYSLRHSTITDLVVSGLDMATVAALAGTSVPMIAKHYAHLQNDRAADALAGLAL
ncbi:tyrosine-type recombinase/integrase [Sphaerotilus uruguayifluvii]|uniref:Integrase n=1 Tax=Sphaerotilus uruguayifluvii TaxID=2735897 RepID=A0ABX2G2J2_9BURK|nr:tyrosine-type recombinase/integrase [Leptothrix sp. C29]NRT56518.1 integrase [Leptothrix sp. C29]